MAIFDTAKAFADFVGVSSSAIWKAKKSGNIRQTEDGKYDSNDPVNRRYIIGVSTKSKAQRGHIDITYEEEDEESKSLEAEKLRADIDYKNRQSRKLDLEHEINKQNLIPVELVAIWIGSFRQGITNNFLQIGNRVARGDKKLRDRIEKEVKKSIEKTLKNAESELRREAEKLIKEMEEKK